jgi:hypothetical protein
VSSISIPELNGRLIEVESQRDAASARAAIYAGRLAAAQVEIGRLTEELATLRVEVDGKDKEPGVTEGGSHADE